VGQQYPALVGGLPRSPPEGIGDHLPKIAGLHDCGGAERQNGDFAATSDRVAFAIEMNLFVDGWTVPD
jgi:hypothetical protein